MRLPVCGNMIRLVQVPECAQAGIPSSNLKFTRRFKIAQRYSMLFGPKSHKYEFWSPRARAQGSVDIRMMHPRHAHISDELRRQPDGARVN